jgi:hypothetical protein
MDTITTKQRRLRIAIFSLTFLLVFLGGAACAYLGGYLLFYEDFSGIRPRKPFTPNEFELRRYRSEIEEYITDFEPSYEGWKLEGAS